MVTIFEDRVRFPYLSLGCFQFPEMVISHVAHRISLCRQGILFTWWSTLPTISETPILF